MTDGIVIKGLTKLKGKKNKLLSFLRHAKKHAATQRTFPCQINLKFDEDWHQRKVASPSHQNNPRKFPPIIRKGESRRDCLLPNVNWRHYNLLDVWRVFLYYDVDVHFLFFYECYQRWQCFFFNVPFILHPHQRNDSVDLPIHKSLQLSH